MSRIFFACCCLIVAFAARAEIIDIDNAELARLAAAGVPLIDVRTASEWEETGIVPGSHLLTFFDERGRADGAAWLKKARTIVKPGDPVALICRSGNRTKAVSRFLSEQAGYAKVYNVRNGFLAWAKERRPVVSAAPALASCRKAKIC
ncbi:MAG: rhodanese-like domain-containing protein [Betaproteobacteria bacterium]|nr:rhodanese-like domain-containing protein [Betaproteobacteria bacterium]